MTLNSFAENMIKTFPLGFVATVTPDGYPNLSPKGTFLVLDDNKIAFADIRSPNTVHNIRHNPDVEINFINQWSRKGIRIRGTARILEKDSHSFRSLITHWQQEWPMLSDRINALVIISVVTLKLLTTPPYDDGMTEDEIVEIYKEKFRKIYP